MTAIEPRPTFDLTVSEPRTTARDRDLPSIDASEDAPETALDRAGTMASMVGLALLLAWAVMVLPLIAPLVLQ